MTPVYALRQGSEDERLRVLVEQAWELRGSPYLVDACRAIAVWHERRALRAFEQRQEAIGRLVRLMRETDPSRIVAAERAA